MFTKKLEIIFLLTIIIAISILGLNYYKTYTFKHNDISTQYKIRIQDKEKEVLQNMQREFGFTFKVPLIVTDAFKGRLYGLTSYKDGSIDIYLNKKVMRESMDYMIESVIAHEYAHALMFKLGKMNTTNDGHNKEWQKVCTLLGGIDCKQYVNHTEIIMSKMPFQ